MTLFPQYFVPLVQQGVVGRALREGSFVLKTHLLRGKDPRDFKGVDDAPYGGGHGMVMRPDILRQALEQISDLSGQPLESFFVILPSPRGERWNQAQAEGFSRRLMDGQRGDIIFICGRYEGVDERFIEKYVHWEVSLGDYILSGAEVATMAILDSALRLCPGVLGHPDSPLEESFRIEGGLLEAPLYTRPEEFEGLRVPAPLTSGDPKKLAQWKKEQVLKVTEKYRPDIFSSPPQREKGRGGE